MQQSIKLETRCLLCRNLYKDLTYVQIAATYTEPEPEPETEGGRSSSDLVQANVLMP
jgi:hypothetical protein